MTLSRVKCLGRGFPWTVLTWKVESRGTFKGFCKMQKTTTKSEEMIFYLTSGVRGVNDRITRDNTLGLRKDNSATYGAFTRASCVPPRSQFCLSLLLCFCNRLSFTFKESEGKVSQNPHYCYGCCWGRWTINRPGVLFLAEVTTWEWKRSFKWF